MVYWYQHAVTICHNNYFIVYQEKEFSQVMLMEPLSDSFLMMREQAYPKYVEPLVSDINVT